MYFKVFISKSWEKRAAGSRRRFNQRFLQEKIRKCDADKKQFKTEVEAHSVRIAELMKNHEHGVLNTTGYKLLIDFVTKTTKRPDSKKLQTKYPGIYSDVIKETASRKVKVSVHPI